MLPIGAVAPSVRASTTRRSCGRGKHPRACQAHRDRATQAQAGHPWRLPRPGHQPADHRLTAFAAPRRAVVALRCRNWPLYRSRRHRCAAPRAGDGARPPASGGPGRRAPALMPQRGADLVGLLGHGTELGDAVFLGGLIVPLATTASRSLPAVASHAIGFAEP